MLLWVVAGSSPLKGSSAYEVGENLRSGGWRDSMHRFRLREHWSAVPYSALCTLFIVCESHGASPCSQVLLS